ncbi:hypothetical protein G5V65_11255 [Rhodobacter sp. HX-7-19]|uniref:Uncharacterized protein n=1 Tax=Paragemmobacter kunshanensis TaxID=2583234 RepID=A0A6M1U1X9_9RHOB|nr:hypothetical protein [Rhodobacter kunshanensis]NGQ91474.1 hypothetical protein [Rhodobacter kunshanensis]
MMTLKQQRDYLSKRYFRLVKIGDRAGAKEVAEQLRQIVAQILRGA